MCRLYFKQIKQPDPFWRATLISFLFYFHFCFQVESLFSDVGGTAGLYIGFSLITFLEFGVLAIELLKRCCSGKRSRQQQQQQGQLPTFQPQQPQHPAANIFPQQFPMVAPQWGWGYWIWGRCFAAVSDGLATIGMGLLTLRACYGHLHISRMVHALNIGKRTFNHCHVPSAWRLLLERKSKPK